MLDAKLANIQPTPTMIPPVIITMRGPYFSNSLPAIGINIAKNARKNIYGSPLAVAPMPKYCSSGFLKTLHE
jgi:hypothetical protein